MAYKRNKFNLGYDVWDYDVNYLESLPEADLRKEYSRLRDIAQKRLKRLSNSEWTWTQTYQRNKEGFATLKEIGNKNELAKELHDIAHFVYSKASSISGMEEIRQNSLDSLENSPYNFIDSENWNMWTQFLNSISNVFDGHSPIPEEVVDELRNYEHDPEEAKRIFQKWVKSQYGIDLDL